MSSFGEFGIPKFEAGQRVVAEDLDEVARQAARGYSGGDAYVDATGVYPAAAAFAGRSLSWEFGVLDGSLATAGTATMSIWQGPPWADTGDNITVYAPLLLAGSLAANTVVWALMNNSNGKWYVMGAECD